MAVCAFSGRFFWSIVLSCFCYNHVTQVFVMADVSCSWTDYDGRLSCSGVMSEIEMGKTIQKYEKRNIEELELLNSELRFISHDAFLGTKVKRITLKDTTLMSLSDTSTAFEGLENHLQNIRVMRCTLVNHWNWKQLANLQKLYSVDVRQSNIDYISDFSDTEITYINLPYNGITGISPTAFNKVHRVFGFHLDHNEITALKRSSFPQPAPKLFMIDLSYNKIRHLPADMFDDMPRLRDLYLQYNQIRTIDEKAFKPVWKLLMLFVFQGNQLICDCRLKWLVKVGVPTRYLLADCDSPRELRGKSIRDLHVNDLWC